MTQPVTKSECKDKRDEVKALCEERKSTLKGDIDNLGESHRRLEDQLVRVEKKIDTKFDSLYRILLVMAVGMLGSLGTAIISLLDK